MNDHFHSAGRSLTTRAVDEMPPRRWTVAEIDAMVRAGIIDEGERFELIEGDAVPMPAKDIRHEMYKGSLLRRWLKRATDS